MIVGGDGCGMFTTSNLGNYRRVCEDVRVCPVMKVIQAVLKCQYSYLISGAVKRLNTGSDDMFFKFIGSFVENMCNSTSFD